jgi:putative FmdB family regulatory protein
MPTYDYECTKCGHNFEKFQSITAEALKKCPKCKGKIRRLIGTGAGIIFKGSGFYQTDYRKPSYTEGAQKDKSASSSSSDSKPADKSETKAGKSETKTDKK